MKCVLSCSPTNIDQSRSSRMIVLHLQVYTHTHAYMCTRPPLWLFASLAKGICTHTLSFTDASVGFSFSLSFFFSSLPSFFLRLLLLRMPLVRCITHRQMNSTVICLNGNVIEGQMFFLFSQNYHIDKQLNRIGNKACKWGVRERPFLAR